MTSRGITWAGIVASEMFAGRAERGGVELMVVRSAERRAEVGGGGAIDCAGILVDL